MTINRIDRLRGVTFQRFCDLLLSAHDPSFHAVDGAGGDMGSDGFAARSEVCYQAYSPDVRELAKLKRKIDDTVAKVSDLRARGFPGLRKLVFLTPFDLTIGQHMYLRDAATGAGFESESWGEARLLALLADHPAVKTEFPEFLLPDLLVEIRNLGVQVADLRAERSMDEDDVLSIMEDVGGVPWIHVLQPNPDQPATSCAAYEYFRLYVVSPALALSSIEPDDEDLFRDEVRDRFWEDASADIETRDHQRVLVQHGAPAYAFHRRWGRWTSGMVTMVSTIEDLNRRGSYSVAEIACDVTRALRLAANLGGDGPARVVFGCDPGKLQATFELSHGELRGAARARLDGVQSVERPALKESRERVLSVDVDLASLASDAHTIAASLMVPALRYFHLARIDSKGFAASIPRLIAASLEVYRRGTR